MYRFKILLFLVAVVGLISPIRRIVIDYQTTGAFSPDLFSLLNSLVLLGLSIYILTWREKFGYGFVALLMLTNIVFAVLSLFRFSNELGVAVALGIAPVYTYAIFYLVTLICAVPAFLFSMYYFFFVLKQEKKYKAMSDKELVGTFFRAARKASELEGQAPSNKSNDVAVEAAWSAHELKKRDKRSADLLKQALTYDDLSKTDAARQELMEKFGEEALGPLRKEWAESNT